MSEAADGEPRGPEITEPEDSLPPVELADLSDRLRSACKGAGWASLMPVQSRTIPYFLAGRDLMIQSRTGSGKTGAFLLPMLERVDPSKNACQALVLVPTRELALQVATEAELLAKGSGIRIVAVYGGTRYKGQLEAFREGAHIVIGTPGRILDHLMRRSLSLERSRSSSSTRPIACSRWAFFPTCTGCGAICRATA